MNHGVDSLGDFLQLGNAPVKNETTQLASNSTECQGPASPPPPIGEAAALIARLLAGSEPHAGVREEISSSIPTPEPAPTDSHSIPTVFAGPFASLLADHNDTAVPPSPNLKPVRRYHKTAVSLMIVALIVLTFGSGLAVGYGILGRRSKAAGKSNAQEATPAAIRNAAASQTVANEANELATADASSVNPTVKPLESSALPLVQANSTSLPDTGSDNDLQSPTVQPRNMQREQPSATTGSPLAPHSSSVLGNRSPSTNSDSGLSAATAAPPVSIPLSRRPAFESATQSLLTSTQSAHPESASVDFVHAENIPPATSAPDAGNTSALPTIISGATKAPVPVASPAEPKQASASSMGRIDPCQLIHSVQPLYPSDAKRLHVEGDVQLRVVVNVDGIVTSVGLVSGPPLLVPAAIDAARGFRYKPAMLNGKPIETVQTIAMSFNLKN